jgi:hypothetical protein
MKKTDIAYLACRILAIYIFFRALQNLSFIPLFFQGSAEPVMRVLMVLTALVPFLILAALSAVLWIFAGRFVQYLLPRSEEVDEQVLMINTKEIYTIAFAVVGVVIVAITIPEFFQIIPNITVLKSQAPFTDPMFKLQTTFALIEKIVQFAIGFGLIFGRRGLSVLLSKIREAG